MAPFDGPGVAAAQIQIDGINGAGGVLGRPLELRTIDTQDSDPDQTKAAAIELVEGGAHILFVTCDVDFATPAIQEGISRGVLTVAPCIGTDQMGPQRFGEEGKLAFTVGNVAQDEGAVMAEFAIDQGWTRAAVVKDNLIVYFRNVVDAFAERFVEGGGEIVATEEYLNSVAGAETGGTIQNVITNVDGLDVDVIAISTAFDDLPAFVGGLRSLGNETPIICSWACDGTYWTGETTTNFYVDTYVSVYGDDPDPAVRDFIGMMEAAGAAPATGGFITAAAAVEAVAAAIEQAGGTDGAALAEVFESFDGFPTISGEISYSPELHAVSGRAYRIVRIDNGAGSFVEQRAATSPAGLG